MTHPPCHPYGKLTVHSKVPLRFRCAVCHRTFSSRLGTQAYGSKLTTELLKKLEQELDKGLSVRQIARSLNLSPSTVFRWKNTL